MSTATPQLIAEAATIRARIAIIESRIKDCHDAIMTGFVSGHPEVYTAISPALQKLFDERVEIMKRCVEIIDELTKP